MYNRYIGNTGKYYKVEEPRDREPARRAPPPPPSPLQPPACKGEKPPARPPSGKLGGFLSSFLPDGIDTGDLLLIILLLLLYNESGDEEYLIILAAVFLIH